MSEEISLQVDADFPGGNIIVDGIDGDLIRVHPNTRYCAEDWFYWHFRVRNGAGRLLRFEFPSGPIFTGAGPNASFDGGKTWNWLGYGCVESSRVFTCMIPGGVQDARFCVTFPYGENNFKAWLGEHADRPGLKLEAFCRSAKGRNVELVRLLAESPGKIRRLLFTVRHHACETMANFVLEGALGAMLSGELAGNLKGLNVEVIAVPFMDKDGVEEGEQGKSRRPHDHGRDYEGKSLYPETGTLRRLFPDWAGQRLSAVVDLHCPWIRGELNERIYQVGSKAPEQWAKQRQFGALLERIASGPLRYRQDGDLPFGQDWNNDKDWGAGMSFTPWAVGIPGVLFATCIEIPYGLVQGRAISPDSARAFGRDLAAALAVYLSQESAGLS